MNTIEAEVRIRASLIADDGQNFSELLESTGLRNAVLGAVLSGLVASGAVRRSEHGSYYIR